MAALKEDVLKYFKPGTSEPKLRFASRLARGKSRKGAIHWHRETFLSRSLMDISPAEYRHYHHAKRKVRYAPKVG